MATICALVWGVHKAEVWASQHPGCPQYKLPAGGPRRSTTAILAQITLTYNRKEELLWFSEWPQKLTVHFLNPDHDNQNSKDGSDF